jgi:GT2 family glycosyltransferase
MARIFDITPKSRDFKPVLMLITSHRIDCFLLCVKCLELYTDLDRFKAVYVLANEVSDEHAVIIKAFQKRHRNVIDVHCAPRGISPSVMGMQNYILRRHQDDVIVRLDEDVFVTPRWLEHMLAAYKIHRNRSEMALVTCLSPVSRIGRQCLDRLMRQEFPDERKRLPDLPLTKNAVYHRFIWEKILEHKLMEAYFLLDKPKHHYISRVDSHCMLFDDRLLRYLLPLPVKSKANRPDEDKINALIKAEGLKTVVVSDAIVHHFAYREAEDYLRKHVSLDDVWWYMTCLDEAPEYGQSLRFAPPEAKSPKLRTLLKDKDIRILY